MNTLEGSTERLKPNTGILWKGIVNKNIVIMKMIIVVVRINKDVTHLGPDSRHLGPDSKTLGPDSFYRNY